MKEKKGVVDREEKDKLVLYKASIPSKVKTKASFSSPTKKETADIKSNKGTLTLNYGHFVSLLEKIEEIKQAFLKGNNFDDFTVKTVCKAFDNVVVVCLKELDVWLSYKSKSMDKLNGEEQQQIFDAIEYVFGEVKK